MLSIVNYFLKKLGITKQIPTLIFFIQILLCRAIFSTTPIADMKTTSEVEPAEMKGSGTPVGGIEPVKTTKF